VPDQASASADAHLQRLNAGQLANRFDECQSASHRSLGIVLMGLGIAEIDQDAVAHVFGDKAAEALHSLSDALLISRNDLAQTALCPQMQTLALSKGHMSRL